MRKEAHIFASRDMKTHDHQTPLASASMSIMSRPSAMRAAGRGGTLFEWQIDFGQMAMLRRVVIEVQIVEIDREIPQFLS
jgi:hypothetical protein